VCCPCAIRSVESSDLELAMRKMATPNLCQRQGHQLHVTYSTTSIDGKPQFTYWDASQTLNFRGDEVRTLDSEVGTLESVTTLPTIDNGSTSFSLLVPLVNFGPSN
jgi:hypothetical protein